MALSGNRVGIALLAFALGVPRLAQADQASAAAAQTLFVEAKRLMDEKRFAEACPKLEESQRLDPATGTLLNLAVCEQKLGHLARAWSLFTDAEAKARSAGQNERAQLAHDQAAKLSAELVYVVVNVVSPEQSPGLEVRCDDQPLGPAQWGHALPMDPGQHTVQATALGRAAFSRTISAEHGSSTVVITVPVLPLESAPVALPPQPAATTPEYGPPQAAQPPAGAPQPSPLRSAPAPTQPLAGSETGRGASDPGASGTRTLGYVVGGVGLVGVIVGSYFGLRAISKNGDSKDHCRSSTLCSQQGVDLRNEAYDAATLSTIGFGVGIAGLAVGGILLGSSSGGSSAPPAAGWQRPGGVQLSAGGTF